jgi:adenylate cyclase
MTLCVERCHGMVDKFIGDAVMAVFSLPVPHPDTDAERAVLAALMMRDELERFNRKLPQAPLTWPRVLACKLARWWQG